MAHLHFLQEVSQQRVSASPLDTMLALEVVALDHCLFQAVSGAPSQEFLAFCSVGCAHPPPSTAAAPQGQLPTPFPSCGTGVDQFKTCLFKRQPGHRPQPTKQWSSCVHAFCSATRGPKSTADRIRGRAYILGRHDEHAGSGQQGRNKDMCIN